MAIGGSGKGHFVDVYSVPTSSGSGVVKEFSSLVLICKLGVSLATEVTSLDWSSDSRYIVAASSDYLLRVFPVKSALQ